MKKVIDICVGKILPLGQWISLLSKLQHYDIYNCIKEYLGIEYKDI